MAILIQKPAVVKGGGIPAKRIEEFFGRVNSRTQSISIARMKAPGGWKEPGQTPAFDEYTVVLKGALRVRLRDGQFDVRAGQAILVRKGEWVQYSTSSKKGAEYVAICLPAFSPEKAHRDE